MADEEQATPAATPAALAHAEELGVDLSAVEGSGVDGKITKADVAAAASAPADLVDPEPDLAEREAREAAFLEQKARGGAEVPGWPGVKVETPEEHDARRRAEQNAGT